ncbi:unnamed protein product [Symbiodinium sp. CCMP2592]|nr:unnamed protein product [Symbiodinium sp. CCMP2592]
MSGCAMEDEATDVFAPPTINVDVSVKLVVHSGPLGLAARSIMDARVDGGRGFEATKLEPANPSMYYFAVYLTPAAYKNWCDVDILGGVEAMLICENTAQCAWGGWLCGKEAGVLWRNLCGKLEGQGAHADFAAWIEHSLAKGRADAATRSISSQAETWDAAPASTAPVTPSIGTYPFKSGLCTVVHHPSTLGRCCPLLQPSFLCVDLELNVVLGYGVCSPLTWLGD